MNDEDRLRTGDCFSKYGCCQLDEKNKPMSFNQSSLKYDLTKIRSQCATYTSETYFQSNYRKITPEMRCI